MIKDFGKIVISDDFRAIFSKERIAEIQSSNEFSFGSFWTEDKSKYISFNGFKYGIVEINCNYLHYSQASEKITLTTYDYECGETDHYIYLKDTGQNLPHALLKGQNLFIFQRLHI